MAMTTGKVVLFMSSKSNGWSETYYYPAADLNALFDAAKNLANKRVALMASPSQIDSIRVNDVDRPRASQLTEVDLVGSIAWQSRSDNPNVAAMMRLYNTSDSRTRAIYLRGNPDNVFDLANPVNADAQDWQTKFAAFGAFLQGSGTPSGSPWLIKVNPRPDMTNKLPITAWQAHTPTKNSLVTATGYGVAVQNDFVTIYKVKGLPFAPGKTLVVGPGAGADQLIVRYRTPNDFAYEDGGYLVKYTPGYVSINSYAANPRFTRHATGRPSDVSRGRRRSILR